MLEDVTTIAFAGDWHGNTHYAKRALSYAKKNNADVVVHVGDFQIRSPYRFVTTIGDEAERLGLVVMFVDGNHEDFTWLLEQPLDNDGVRRLHPYVWHLPRGFRWEWYGVRFLALGGAYSVDRSHGTENVSWWSQEELSIADMAAALQGGEVDVMVTHDCPDRVPRPLHNDMRLPENVLNRAVAHRAALGMVVDEVNPRFLFHGHYHVSYQGVRESKDGKGRDTSVIGLDMDGTEFKKNMKIVEIVDIMYHL